MKVKVTEQNIKNGLPANNCKCPIALALIDAGYEAPHVNNDHFTCRRDGYIYYANMPSEAVSFVSRFDDEEKVTPFEFEVNEETLD